jgi:hypothetical protein
MRDDEMNRQHMLLVIEAAQRAGRSETEIAEIVDGAAETDAELEAAA